MLTKGSEENSGIYRLPGMLYNLQSVWLGPSQIQEMADKIAALLFPEEKNQDSSFSSVVTAIKFCKSG